MNVLIQDLERTSIKPRGKLGEGAQESCTDSIRIMSFRRTTVDPISAHFHQNKTPLESMNRVQALAQRQANMEWLVKYKEYHVLLRALRRRFWVCGS